VHDERGEPPRAGIGSKCLITGESLGQVASQTIENMTVTNSMAELPVLRPLVGMDKDEIIATAKSIGTYETSILPYEDVRALLAETPGAEGRGRVHPASFTRAASSPLSRKRSSRGPIPALGGKSNPF
jgi:hypothetical protein